MCLHIVLLSLRLENLLADLCMLLVGFRVEAAAATSALNQVLRSLIIFFKRLWLELVHRSIVYVLIHWFLVRWLLHTGPL